MNENFKAWTFTHGGFPEALQLSTITQNASPLKPSELCVRVKAASINPVDAQLMGFPPFAYIPNMILPFHKGVGEDFSGIVEQAGKDTGFKTGDEVFGIAPFLPGGTLQERIRIDLHHKECVAVLKPKPWSWEQAASLPLVWMTAETTIHAVASYVPMNGKIAILGGSSSCGMYAVYIARQRGWTVIASCSGRNEEFVKSMGASETIDYTSTSVAKKLKDFAPDAIVDFVGGTECLGIAKRYVSVVGDKTNRMTMGGRNIYLWNPQMLLRALLGRMGLGASYSCVNIISKSEDLERSLNLPEEKIVVDSVYQFDQVRDAFARLNAGRTRGKVVVQIGDSVLPA